MDDPEWNEGYALEGLDRTHIIMCMVNEFLVGHPAVVKAGLTCKVEVAANLLMEVYQAIGQLEEEDVL